MLSSRGFSQLNPGIEPMSPTLQADSLPIEPAGKPKNTGEGSPSLLQGIFLTQGLNPGLLHCKQILYHLSHQGSPQRSPEVNKNASAPNVTLRKSLACKQAIFSMANVDWVPKNKELREKAAKPK